MTAIRTYPGPVARIPAEVQTAAYRAVKGVAFAVFPEGTLTGFLVRISLAEISQIHSNSFLLDNNTAAKSAPSTMMAVQTLLNLDDCGYSLKNKAKRNFPINLWYLCNLYLDALFLLRPCQTQNSHRTATGCGKAVHSVYAANL